MEKAIFDPKNGPVSLTDLRSLLKTNGLFALLVRSTDRYFNEYVPKNLSIRAHLTGFDGSVGDAIITTDSAHLFVDGRYTLQAKTQAKEFIVHQCQNSQSIETTWLTFLKELIRPNDVLAYDPNTIDLCLFERLFKEISTLDGKIAPDGPMLFSQLFGDSLNLKDIPDAKIFAVNPNLCGQTLQQKVALLAPILEKFGVHGFLTVKLDDIAWLTNLRSHFFPFQTAVPGIACALLKGVLFGIHSCFNGRLPSEKQLDIVNESEIFQALKKNFARDGFILGIDRNETSKAHEIALHELKIELKHIENPISTLKAIKNEKELLHMRSAFKKADFVVYQTQNFINNSFEDEQALSEANVNDYVEEEFKKSGATQLSFRPICASGKNGAIIHYGTPSHKEVLANGSLFLLDTGAYYEGGYATDLTRTFLAAKKSTRAKPWQREMFTLVLKASIRGLSARIRRGTIGMQLDAMVREPLWQAGLDFAHGTGHGVGINVHEFPPRIGPSSNSPLLLGQVFSIEPGLYFEGLGGVRIENLVTIVKDFENSDFLRVLPLTFCPLDERLIEEKMLDAYDVEFLKYYRNEWENQAPWPNLPPLPSYRFA